MATKSKKQSAAATSSASSTTIELVSTPQQSTPSTPSRSMSPTRLSRLQERAELQNLNDRLAAYIDRNRQLETENSRLKVQVQKSIESREIHSIKKLYESELGDTRNSLDTIAREKAAAELQLSRAQEDLKKAETRFVVGFLIVESNSILSRLNKKTTEVGNLEKKVNNQEAQLDDMRNKIAQGIAERKKLEADIKALNDEVKTNDDKLENLKQQLEEETLLRVDLENRNQSLNEELNFQRELFQKELEQVRTKEYEIKETYQETIKEQYEQKLQKELKELREENENRVAFYRQEVEDKYETQLAALQDDLDHKSDDLAKANTKIKQLNSTYTFMTTEVDQLKRENQNLKDKVADLNKLIEQEREWNKTALDRKEDEIAELRSKFDALLEEHKDLMDDKIKLDAELAVYRKLLEGEETRLNISPPVSSSSVFSTSMSSSSAATTSQTGSYTPRAYIPRGNKRKRICLQEEENVTDVNVKATAKGDIEISDHDQDGKFVKLRNKGEKEISLGGWQLLRSADGLETRFKFHRSIIAKPGQVVTVWSSDSNAIHSPPNDIVMKAQTWFTADKMLTTLFNNNNEVRKWTIL